ncbi:30S ribosomal protein S2 [Candidatus Micrarchaeota archaeon]|nr:30S ribosomal protein S2 [Candidatus Micrarchaeota archaeon]MBI5177401.1 30S ribosomal protein S2 [Candidatus Micrarchaeota archaeon]
MAEFLIAQEKYLEAGVHIGTKMRQGSMKAFIYKTRDDGLNVLDLKRTDERVRAAAHLIAQYPAEKVYIVGSKDNAQTPIAKFCELTGCRPLSGRFTPGRFTNPRRTDFVEPTLVMVTDPGVDRQAVKEAFELNAPIIALTDTNNSFRFIDLAVPANNKGRKSLALLFFLIARQILKERGTIASDDEFPAALEDFAGEDLSVMPAPAPIAAPAAAPAPEAAMA